MVQIDSIAFVSLVRLHPDFYVQIAGRNSSFTGLALTGHPKPRPVGHPGRNLHRDGPIILHGTVPAAFRTGIDDQLTTAPTAVARNDGHHGPKHRPPRHSNRPGTAAVGTHFRHRPGCGAPTRARPAIYPPLEVDRGAGTERGLGEIDLDRHQHISASLRGVTPGGSEQTRISEHRSQEVVECPQIREQIPDVDPIPAIVPAAPLRVGQHLVGLGDLTEPRFGGRVVRVGVRVAFTGEAAERLLDLLCGRIASDAQRCVVVRRHGYDPRLSARFSLTSSTIEIVRL